MAIGAADEREVVNEECHVDRALPCSVERGSASGCKVAGWVGTSGPSLRLLFRFKYQSSIAAERGRGNGDERPFGTLLKAPGVAAGVLLDLERACGNPVSVRGRIPPDRRIAHQHPEHLDDHNRGNPPPPLSDNAHPGERADAGG